MLQPPAGGSEPWAPGSSVDHFREGELTRTDAALLDQISPLRLGGGHDLSDTVDRLQGVPSTGVGVQIQPSPPWRAGRVVTGYRNATIEGANGPTHLDHVTAPPRAVRPSSNEPQGCAEGVGVRLGTERQTTTLGTFTLLSDVLYHCSWWQRTFPTALPTRLGSLWPFASSRLSPSPARP